MGKVLPYEASLPIDGFGTTGEDTQINLIIIRGYRVPSARFFLLPLLVGVFLAGCAAPMITQLSGNTYQIKGKDYRGGFGKPADFVTSVKKEATDFAASQGMVLEPVSMSEVPMGPMRFYEFEYTFKLVDPNQPATNVDYKQVTQTPKGKASANPFDRFDPPKSDETKNSSASASCDPDGAKPCYVAETFSDGCVYQGFMQRGKRQGEGKCTWSDGTVSEGVYVNNTMRRGTVLDRNGNLYTGEVKNGTADGMGEIRYKDGKRFEGLVRAGKPVKGTYITPDGSKYIGTIRNGYPDGRGVAYAPDGSFIYAGNWVEGNPDGVTDANGLTCLKYGFKPRTTDFAKCRQQLDMAAVQSSLIQQQQRMELERQRSARIEQIMRDHEMRMYLNDISNDAARARREADMARREAAEYRRQYEQLDQDRDFQRQIETGKREQRGWTWKP